MHTLLYVPTPWTSQDVSRTTARTFERFHSAEKLLLVKMFGPVISQVLTVMTSCDVGAFMLI